jgi:hypothetical protein
MEQHSKPIVDASRTKKRGWRISIICSLITILISILIIQSFEYIAEPSWYVLLRAWSLVCVLTQPLALIGIIWSLKFESVKYKCGKCGKRNNILTTEGTVKKTTTGYEGITSLNPAVGAYGGHMGVAGLTSTQQVPVEVGLVEWTGECSKCGTPNRWSAEVKIRRWTDNSGEQSFEIMSRKGP